MSENQIVRPERRDPVHFLGGAISRSQCDINCDGFWPNLSRHSRYVANC
jgi:hypothetical protein